jgi:anti-sigma-K factor RskA
MVESHVLDQLPAYALGCLDEAEMLQVADHLRQCAACAAELTAYQPVLEALPLAVSEQTPARQVKTHLLQRVQVGSKVQVSPKTSWKTWWGNLFRQPTRGLAFSLVLIVLLALGNIGLWLRLAQSEDREFRTVALTGTANASAASGLLVIGHDGNLGTLVVDDLPVLDADHQYQLWLIKDGKRTSGGIFSTDPFGYGALAISAPEPLKSYDAVGITIEPVGGSPAPTGQKVMGGDL